MLNEDVMTAYDRAHDKAVLVARDDLRYVRVYGRDPARMVQGLISNDVAKTTAGRAVYAAVLSAKGRLVADVRVLRRGDELLLESHRDALDSVLAHLRKFVPPLFARFEPADEWRCVSVYGPGAQQAVEKISGVAASPAEDDVAEGVNGMLVIGSAYAGVAGFDVVHAAEPGAGIADALRDEGVSEATLEALEALRIEAGTPRWGTELDANVIPLEAGLRSRAISESKGCYTGQEVIIRILHRGHVNWLLRGVLLGDTPAEPGAGLVDAAGKRVARLTSVSWSPREAQYIALGYVRREVEPEAELRREDGEGSVARVTSLPWNLSRITH